MSMFSRRNLLAAFLTLPPIYALYKYLSPPIANVGGTEVAIRDLPENGVYMLRDRKAAIIRKDNEIRAISIACTHLGCTLNVVDDEFICPCHGSRFSLFGVVRQGPATVDLKELRYERDGDVVRLYI